MSDAHSTAVPLCVDLDGTLLKTDSTWEAVALLMKHKPLLGLLLPVWRMKGKAHLKEKLMEHVAMDIQTLPFNQPFLEFLKTEHAQGRTIVLVTGAARSVALAVQEHLPLFSEVIATGEGINLTGKRKAAALVKRYGEKGFDYVGNSLVDLLVWPYARHAIVVNAPASVHRKAGKAGNVERAFDDRPSVVRAFFRAIRPHQWMKNVLIFVPLVTSHQLADGPVVARACLAFVSFCLCTSSVYLLNDLFDLTADRGHPRKRFRPLASGDLSISFAMAAVPVLLLAGLGLSTVLPPLFTLVLICYFVTTLAYSFYIKQLVLIDVMVLAGLYTIRIIAGHAATSVPYSLWLLMFSMFFFLSLALVKRYSELEVVLRENRSAIAGRGYRVGDREQVGILGSASGYIAALILALYITSESVIPLYTKPYLLWLIIPLILYWVSRIWLLAHRGEVHDDPVVFALKDRVSYGVGLLIVAVLILAT